MALPMERWESFHYFLLQKFDLFNLFSNYFNLIPFLGLSFICRNAHAGLVQNKTCLLKNKTDTL